MLQIFLSLTVRQTKHVTVNDTSPVPILSSPVSFKALVQLNSHLSMRIRRMKQKMCCYCDAILTQMTANSAVVQRAIDLPAMQTCECLNLKRSLPSVPLPNQTLSFIVRNYSTLDVKTTRPIQQKALPLVTTCKRYQQKSHPLVKKEPIDFVTGTQMQVITLEICKSATVRPT